MFIVPTYGEETGLGLVPLQHTVDNQKRYHITISVPERGNLGSRQFSHTGWLHTVPPLPTEPLRFMRRLKRNEKFFNLDPDQLGRANLSIEPDMLRIKVTVQLHDSWDEEETSWWECT